MFLGLNHEYDFFTYFDNTSVKANRGLQPNHLSGAQDALLGRPEGMMKPFWGSHLHLMQKDDSSACPLPGDCDPTFKFGSLVDRSGSTRLRHNTTNNGYGIGEVVRHVQTGRFDLLKLGRPSSVIRSVQPIYQWQQEDDDAPR
jgi:hypothetical protein